MKRLFTLTLLLLGISCAIMAQQPTGSQPTSGETYYLYNVGQGKYLSAASDGSLTLGGTPYLAVTLNQPTTTSSSADASFFTLEANGQKIIASLWNSPILGDNQQGYYDQWQFSAVSGKTYVYTMGVRNREAGAGMFLYWTDILNKGLVTLPLKLATVFTNGQWMLVAEDDIQTVTITLNETDAAEAYSTNQKTEIASSATVKLGRTFTMGSWNSFCVPFSIDNAQLTSQFGTDVLLAEFTGLDASNVKFTTVSAAEAGKPYLIKPTKDKTNGYYEFTGVTSLLASPTAQSQSYANEGTTYGVTFTGSFCKTTAPSRSFVLRKDKVYHLTSDMEMKGFRAYFTNSTNASENSTAKVTGWMLDDTTDGITSVEDMGSMTFDVYNTAGQKVRSQATSLDALPAGVYIVNGKKITK